MHESVLIRTSAPPKLLDTCRDSACRLCPAHQTGVGVSVRLSDVWLSDVLAVYPSKIELLSSHYETEGVHTHVYFWYIGSRQLVDPGNAATVCFTHPT